jgi:hypothetical protein
MSIAVASSLLRGYKHGVSNTIEISRFPEAKLESARKLVAKAYKRLATAARKAGAAEPIEPTITVIRSRLVDVPMGNGYGNYKVRVVDLEVVCERPVIAGWEFLAVIEPLDGGNLIRSVPGSTVADGELDAFRNSSMRCDHCDKVRRRSETFVLRDITGTTKQVGRQCLTYFLGGKSAAAIIASLDVEKTIRGEGEGGIGGGNGDPLFTPLSLLEQTAAVVRVDGWMSRTTARTKESTRSTVDLVLFMWGPRPTGENAYHAQREWDRLNEKCGVTDADRQHAAGALAWASQLEGRSDYEQNLRLLCAQEVIDGAKAGVVASAIAGYDRHLGKLRERAALPVSTHVGAVGDKIERTVTVERVASFDNQWGGGCINVMRSEAGEVLVWKTGRSVGAVGEKLTIAGKVKAHTDYKGMAQTELTRCTVAAQPEA